MALATAEGFRNSFSAFLVGGADVGISSFAIVADDLWPLSFAADSLLVDGGTGGMGGQTAAVLLLRSGGAEFEGVCMG